MIADAQITFLPSSDLERSRTFYEGVLGLELVVDQGTCHIFRVAEGAFLGTCQWETVEVTEGVIFTFVTDDVDGWCSRVVGAGGRIESGPEHSAQYGIYHAFLRDSDGHRLEIQRFDDPEWYSAPKER
jgi:catechol 2,3-dioxygenase-like lactoylglutathione lyase family enzyme